MSPEFDVRGAVTVTAGFNRANAANVASNAKMFRGRLRGNADDHCVSSATIDLRQVTPLVDRFAYLQFKPKLRNERVCFTTWAF